MDIQIHFVYVLWTGQMMNYPLLQVVPSFLELFLAFMIVCTMGINILSQILQYGRIARPLFAPGAGALPARDEEFCLALVRLGTSSVDATSAAGLGNEVAPIPSNSRKGGTVRLGPSGVVQIELSGQRKSNARSRKAYANNPFATEIKHVRAVSAEGDMWINITWLKELYRFGVTLWRFMQAMWMAIRAKGRVESPPAGEHDSSIFQGSNNDAQRSQEKTDDIYSRFLAGESISDDERSEYSHETDSDSSSDSDSTEEEVTSSMAARTGTPNTDEWADQETSQLYTEHGSQRATTPLAPVLLAHLTAQTGSPLTRRKYSSMLLRDNAQEGDTLYGAPSKSSTGSYHPGRMDIDDDEASMTRRMCVICLCSDRTVICWPCRYVLYYLGNCLADVCRQ